MRVIVFDTETIGKVTQDLLNVGYRIVDIDIQHATATTLIARDYVVTELINNRIYCINDDFVGREKYGMYLTMLEGKQIIKHNIARIFSIMANDLKKYNVLFGYAYNSAFDVDKFNKTAMELNIANPIATIPIFDIWGYAYNYICKTDGYIEWAKENEIFTKTERYIKQSVEAVCQFLYDDLEFVENHTALSDVNHELNILLECIRRGCDITRPMNHKAIYSDKVFTKTLELPDGEIVNLEYTKEYTKGNKTTLK